MDRRRAINKPLSGSGQSSASGNSVFDEADTLDFTAGGGHVAAVIISPLAKRGYKSIAFDQHQSVLRLALEGLGVTKLPGETATAPAMWEFFTTP